MKWSDVVWLCGFGIWLAAAVLVAAAFHLFVKKNRKEPGMVYVTRGRKYHMVEDCHLMHSGEDLWDGDSEGYWHNSGSFRREVETVQEAVMCGKLPCLSCVPVEYRKFPPLYRQTFGHEPVEVPIPGGPHVVECARCSGVEWPCSSAVVLEIVPRNVGGKA